MPRGMAALPSMASSLVALLVGELAGAPLLLGASAEALLEDELSLLQQSARVRGPGAEADFISHKHVPVPSLVVDLDVAPEKRWGNVTRHYKGLGVFPDCCTVGTAEMRSLMPLFDSIPLSEEYRRELEGIAADVNDPRVTVEDLILVNLGYELTGSKRLSPLELMRRAARLVSESAGKPRAELLSAVGSALEAAAGMGAEPSFGCSGVLAAMPDGTVVHGRNMEYGHMEIDVNGTKLRWPEVSVEVTFMKGGKPFIVSTHWPGITGFHTAMRFGGWSFEQNTRDHNMATNLLYGAVKRSQGFMHRAREVMESTPDFQTAVQKIYDSNLMSPQYFVMAGAKPFEGVVLTIDRGGEHRSLGSGTPPPLRLSSTPAGASGSTWYLVQTNDDHFEEARDGRRPQETQRLAALRPGNVTAEWMMGEMLAPTLYKESTVFTTVFVPATGYHSTLAHLGNRR